MDIQWALEPAELISLDKVRHGRRLRVIACERPSQCMYLSECTRLLPTTSVQTPIRHTILSLYRGSGN